MHCDFCGANISDEDKNCRTCGAVVSARAVSVATSAVGRGQPLHEWGVSGPSEAATSAALYRWDAVATSDDSAEWDVDEDVQAAARGKTRTHSRLRVFMLAAVVAVLITVAYVVLVGADSPSPRDDSAGNTAQESPTAAATPTAPVSEATVAPPPPESSIPEPQQPAPAAAAEASNDQPGQPANSLTLTFDQPPTEPSPSP
ncbi:MAG TPA: hypothetical protein VFO84_00575 [Dehalococcoidia bacterium]|nr:hypothetical protein [Dehalococcoidia bacterium]